MTFTDAVTLVTSLVTIVAAIVGVVTYIYNHKTSLDRKHITLVSVASVIGVVLVIIVAREIASLPINQSPGKQNTPSNTSFSGSTPTQAQNTVTANTPPQTLKHPAPVANFTCTSEPGFILLSTRGSSAASGFSIAKYTWDFGDGNHETDLTQGSSGSGGVVGVPPPPQYSHSYSSPGFYTVQLTVTDSGDEISTSYTRQCSVE